MKPTDFINENAEDLNIGDPVIITGPVQFKGKTGDIVDFGKDKRFVVVNLYNYGKHSFHSSDVSYNDYAESGDEQEYLSQFEESKPSTIFVGQLKGTDPASKTRDRLVGEAKSLQSKFEKHLAKHGYDVAEKGRYWGKKLKDIDAQIAAWDAEMERRKQGKNVQTEDASQDFQVGDQVKFLYMQKPEIWRDGQVVGFGRGGMVYVKGERNEYSVHPNLLKKADQGITESTEQAIQKKIQAKQDALGLAKERRRAKGERQQGQREIKLQAEIDKLRNELAQLKKQGVAEGFLGDREYNRVMPFVKRIASEVSDYDRDEFGEELWSLLDQKYGPKFAQSVLDDIDFYWDTYTELTDQQGVAEAVMRGGDEDYPGDPDYEDRDNEDEGFFVAIGNEEDGMFLGMVTRDGGRWREVAISGNPPYNWGGANYMSYLTPQDVKQWINRDYGRYNQVEFFDTEEEARDYVSMMSEGVAEDWTDAEDELASELSFRGKKSTPKRERSTPIDRTKEPNARSERYYKNKEEKKKQGVAEGAEPTKHYVQQLSHMQGAASNRWHTAKINGKPVLFNSKEEALDAVKRWSEQFKKASFRYGGEVQPKKGVAEGEYDDPRWEPGEPDMSRKVDWDIEAERNRPEEPGVAMTVTVRDAQGNVVLQFPSTGEYYGDLKYAAKKGFDIEGDEYHANWQRNEDSVMSEDSGATSEQVASEIVRRIIFKHKDAISAYGPEAIMAAAREVGEFFAGADELGTSDIGIATKYTLEKLDQMSRGALGESASAGATIAGAIATTPAGGAGKNVGSLFGGTYKQKRTKKSPGTK